MSLELKVTTSIAGFGEQSETWVVGPVADREDALRIWQERHELAFGGTTTSVTWLSPPRSSVVTSIPNSMARAGNRRHDRVTRSGRARRRQCLGG